MSFLINKNNTNKIRMSCATTLTCALKNRNISFHRPSPSILKVCLFLKISMDCELTFLFCIIRFYLVRGKIVGSLLFCICNNFCERPLSFLIIIACMNILDKNANDFSRSELNRHESEDNSMLESS